MSSRIRPPIRLFAFAALALTGSVLVAPGQVGATRDGAIDGDASRYQDHNHDHGGLHFQGDVIARPSAGKSSGSWLAPASTDTIVFVEDEDPGHAGENDSPALGQPITGLGAAALASASGVSLARLVGQLSSAIADAGNEVGIADDVRVAEEDDGSIPLANETDLVPRATVSFQGVVGDGPFAETSGDLDFFALGFIDEGETVLVDVDASVNRSTLDSYVTLYDESGKIIATADDDGETLDSLLETEVPFAGTYFVSVGACCGFPSDPFDSGSSVLAGTKGPYVVTLGIGVSRRANSIDVDSYTIDLDAGDVISAGFAGSVRTVTVVDQDGSVMMTSDRNVSEFYPGDSPLRHQGDVGVDHVAAEAGRYALIVEGRDGPYHGEFRLARSAPDVSIAPQRVFLDFDGAELDATILDGRPNAVVSPLSAFLFRWGLLPSEEDKIIDAVILTVVENLNSDLRRGNANPRFDLQILNSRDHPDAWGTPDVTRAIVGGAVSETGLSTIGLAESIDPGNFDREETALVLLDLLSDSAGFSDSSLNDLRIAEDADLADLIGRAIGNVVSHEIGHLLGSYHTESFNGVPSLMDLGGDLHGLIGTGPDRVFGSADDIDIDFALDDFDPSEGLSGTQDTATRARFALSSLARYIPPPATSR